MESGAKLLGHPIHQQLVVFPLGLLGMAAIFDVISMLTSNPRWTEAAFYMIGAGVVTGLVAAVFGAVDWLGIPKRTRAKQVGLLHGIGNAVVLLLFGASFALRWENPSSPGALVYIWSFAGFLIALGTGWLGGELVTRLGVGVDDGAHVDAPSSLEAKSASGPLHRPGV